MSGIKETGVTTVVISLSVYHCGYVCIGVCVGNSVMNPVARSHMFVQSGQDGYECCWTWYRLVRVWMAKW